ncbi:MAG: hypothetical protein WKF92_13750 [Pyrinomonadaceae bacterium]
MPIIRELPLRNTKVSPNAPGVRDVAGTRGIAAIGGISVLGGNNCPGTPAIAKEPFSNFGAGRLPTVTLISRELPLRRTGQFGLMIRRDLADKACKFTNAGYPIIVKFHNDIAICNPAD